MSIRISSGRKGTSIHARGRDAQALFDAICRSVGEPVMARPDDGNCQACINDKCTTGDGCVACSNPPQATTP